MLKFCFRNLKDERITSREIMKILESLNLLYIIIFSRYVEWRWSIHDWWVFDNYS